MDFQLSWHSIKDSYHLKELQQLPYCYYYKEHFILELEDFYQQNLELEHNTLRRVSYLLFHDFHRLPLLKFLLIKEFLAIFLLTSSLLILLSKHFHFLFLPFSKELHAFKQILVLLTNNLLLLAVLIILIYILDLELYLVVLMDWITFPLFS